MLSYSEILDEVREIVNNDGLDFLVRNAMLLHDYDEDGFLTQEEFEYKHNKYDDWETIGEVKAEHEEL
jgi:hypothetical protein